MVIGFVERYQLVLGLAVVAVAAAAVIGYKELVYKAPTSGRQLSALTASKVEVVSASPGKLNAASMAVEVAPTPASGSTQPATSQLQSNVDINNPALANNSLVQSLLSIGGGL